MQYWGSAHESGYSPQHRYSGMVPFCLTPFAWFLLTPSGATIASNRPTTASASPAEMSLGGLVIPWPFSTRPGRTL